MIARIPTLALATAALFAAAAGSAAPFLVSDPYPPAGPQPTEFVISIAGQAAPVVVPAAPSPQGAALRWDLAGRAGAHTVTVKARNQWGESAPTPPFSFYAGPVSPPTELRVLY